MNHEEWIKCARDPGYFLSTYGYVQDRQGHGKLRFELWPHLEDLLDYTFQRDRIVILKARQIGVTWFYAGLALWYALFVPLSNVLVISRRLPEATKFKSRVKFMYDNLPPEFQITIEKNNEDLLVFRGGSEIASLPTSPGSGRSESATIVILDEWAFQEYAHENYTAILPTVEFGKLVGISTANGLGGRRDDGSFGNLFADVWFKAKKSKNNFLPIFIPWTARPGRTDDWLEKQVADLPPSQAAREYPAHEREAFLAAGSCLFDTEVLRAMPVSPGTPRRGGELWVPPVPEQRYAAGIDVAYTGGQGDYSVCQILDENGHQVAKLRSHLYPDEFAEQAFDLLEHYGYPQLAVEVQGSGSHVLSYLTSKYRRDGTEKARYPYSRIYHRSRNQPGWHTGHANRLMILSNLEINIRKGSVRLNSHETVEELLSFGESESTGKYEALTGHDDEVMSLALASYMLEYGPKPFTSDEASPRPYISYLPKKGNHRDDINWRKKVPVARD